MPLSAHEFERRLIFYASPTLTKLKVACIYNLNDLDDLEECIQYYNELLNKKDICYTVKNWYMVFRIFRNEPAYGSNYRSAIPCAIIRNSEK